MTNKKTARIIERLVNGESSSDIRRTERITHHDISTVIAKYIPPPPNALLLEFLFDSRMNDETVGTQIVEKFHG